MTQKVLRIGSSVGVIIPKSSSERIGLKAGDQVSVNVDIKKKKVIIEPAVEVDRELIAWTREFIAKYRLALEALAKK